MESTVWTIIDIEPGDGAGHGGDCIGHANLMKHVIRVLSSKAATIAYLSATPGQPSETFTSIPNRTCLHGHGIEQYLVQTTDGVWWVFEGVCRVDDLYYDVSYSTEFDTFQALMQPSGNIIMDTSWTYRDPVDNSIRKCNYP